MPVRAQFEPRRFEASDVLMRRAEPSYATVLTRLLAAHALAEELTAAGYSRILPTITDPDLRPAAEKNLAEERRHAALIRGLLGELGVDQRHAERAVLTLRRAPSFEAPRYFAERAAGELDLLMGSLSLDSTGLLMIGVNYRESSYAPHSRAAEEILEDEAEHDAFGSRTLDFAVERFGREPVTAALRTWWPMAVNFFGPPGSGFSYDCLRLGLKRQDNDQLAGLFASIMERKLARLGLGLPRLSAGYPHTLA